MVTTVILKMCILKNGAGRQALTMAWSRARFSNICKLTLKGGIPLSTYSYPQRNVLVPGIGLGVRLIPQLGSRVLIRIRQEHQSTGEQEGESE